MFHLRLIALGAVALIAAGPVTAGPARAERIPEPASVSLLVLGAAGLVIGRRLSRRR